MGWISELRIKIKDKAKKFGADKIRAGIVAGIVAMIAGGWAYVWQHFNPQFTYRAPPAGVSSGYVGLAQVLNQIEKDTHRYCSGGWDERFAKIGLRRCYNFKFKPSFIYQIIVCTHDQRGTEITTSDQLRALRHFETRYVQTECFKTVDLGGDAFDIVPGKDSLFQEIKYATGEVQKTAFCGCSSNEITETARTIGAKIP